MNINLRWNVYPFLRSNSKNLEQVLNAMILKLEASRAEKTIRNYRTAVNSFIGIVGHEASIKDLDANLMKRYEKQARIGVKPNTISAYMRSLRKLFNEAGIKNTSAMFKDVFTGNEKTEKRAITKEDLRNLRLLSLPAKSPLCLSRDLFLLSVFCMGTPFVDLAFLEWRHIQNGYIIYTRHKTGQTIRIKITKEIQAIINRYARKGTHYLFPLLTSTDAQKAMKEYETVRRRYNRHLNKLGEMIGLPQLTSYQARHTWASIAYAENTDMPVISKALGHTNSITTQVYISEIDDNRVFEANARIIHSIILYTSPN